MNSPIEPSAEVREMAKTMKAMFNAFVEAGFTERQAITLTSDIMRTAVTQGIEAAK